MTRFTVDSEEVAAATAGLHDTMSRIQSDVVTMHSRLESLQGSWTGEAARAFQSLLTDWRSTQQRVEESLEHIARALEAAGRRYAETEFENARMFAG